jgi:N-acetylglutamate synthase-like GNAT family acetyltransferase
MIRYFDPAKDSIGELARLNDWTPELQAWLEKAFKRRLHAKNYLVMEEDGKLIGAVLLGESCGPILTVEGAYVKPEYRSYKRGRALLQAIDAEAAKRGVTLVFSHAAERIGKGLIQYGYSKMNAASYDLYGQVVPQETK